MGTRNQSKAQISSIHTLPVKIINSLMTVYDNRNNEIQIVVSYKMKQESWCLLDLCSSTCFLSFFYLLFIFHIWFSIFFVIFRPVIFLSNYYFYLFRMVVCTLWTFAVLLALPAVPAYTYEEVCDRILYIIFASDDLGNKAIYKLGECALTYRNHYSIRLSIRDM